MPDAFARPPYYPVCLDLRGARCLVVGAGAVARRKVEGLLAAGGDVRVVAPEISAMPPGIETVERAYRPDDLAGCALVFAATDDARVNARVAEDARARGLWVNVADSPDACSLLLPAVLQRGALQIAVSTGGSSPTLACAIRDELAARYGEAHAALAALLGRLRREWDGEGLTGDERQARWARVSRLPLLAMLEAGETEAAEALARAALAGKDGVA